MVLKDCKTTKFNSKSASKKASYLLDHPFPAVIGPKSHLYITDHHHLGRAILDSASPASVVYVCPEVDFSKAENMTLFWKEMVRA
jgi:hypothetical protein